MGYGNTKLAVGTRISPINGTKRLIGTSDQSPECETAGKQCKATGVGSWEVTWVGAEEQPAEAQQKAWYSLVIKS